MSKNRNRKPPTALLPTAKTPNWLARYKPSRAQLVSGALIFSASVLAFAIVPALTVFTSGTTISSSAMNANFSALDTRIAALEANMQVKPASGVFITSASGVLATAQVNCPATGCWLPAYRNPAGTVTVTTYGTGIYGVTFNGLDLTTGVIQMTGIDFFGPRYCQTVPPLGSSVTVHCHDAAGAYANSAFQLLVIQ